MVCHFLSEIAYQKLPRWPALPLQLDAASLPRNRDPARLPRENRRTLPPASFSLPLASWRLSCDVYTAADWPWSPEAPASLPRRFLCAPAGFVVEGRVEVAVSEALTFAFPPAMTSERGAGNEVSGETAVRLGLRSTKNKDRLFRCYVTGSENSHSPARDPGKEKEKEASAWGFFLVNHVACFTTGASRCKMTVCSVQVGSPSSTAEGKANTSGDLAAAAKGP